MIENILFMLLGKLYLLVNLSKHICKLLFCSDILRKKLNHKLNLKQNASLYHLINLKKAFVYIADKPDIQLAELYATEGLDIIQGDLGRLFSNEIHYSAQLFSIQI